MVFFQVNMTTILIESSIDPKKLNYLTMYKYTLGKVNQESNLFQTMFYLQINPQNTAVFQNSSYIAHLSYSSIDRF